MDMLAAHVVSPQLKPQNHRAPTPTPLLPEGGQIRANFSIIPHRVRAAFSCFSTEYLVCLAENLCLRLSSIFWCSAHGKRVNTFPIVNRSLFYIKVKSSKQTKAWTRSSAFPRQRYSFEQQIRRLPLAASRLYKSESHQTRFHLKRSPGEQKKHKENSSNKSLWSKLLHPYGLESVIFTH